MKGYVGGPVENFDRRLAHVSPVREEGSGLILDDLVTHVRGLSRQGYVYGHFNLRV